MSLEMKTALDKDDRLICACFAVTETEIRSYFEHPHATLDEYIRDSGITSKCTACKMDFELLLETIRTNERHFESNVDAPRVPVRGNVVRDFVDSGFLINRDGITTVLRADNTPNMFDPESAQQLTRYAWHLRVVDEAGKAVLRESGDLEIGESLTIDLAALPGCPELGWFWIWLDPKDAGYFGSIRPQYALAGPGWVSTVHTQPHGKACLNKAVIIRSSEDKFKTLVSVVNASKSKPARCELLLDSTTTDYQQNRVVEVPPNGSRLVSIDDVFGPIGRQFSVANLVISSDEPLRKHIIKIQPNGHYSIDHFPDAN